MKLRNGQQTVFNGLTVTGSFLVSGSSHNIVGNTTINNLTASLFGTSSWSINAASASFVGNSQTASYIEYANVANKPSLFSGSSQVQLNQITGTTFADTLYTFPGDVVVQGNVTAEQLIVSTSVYFVTTSFSSGSTIFGNSSDDRHQFTGSVSVSGSLVVQNLDLLSLSIFRQTGSVWATTNNLQITGSTNISGNLVVNGIISGNFYGPGDNISFTRIGTSQSAVSELVIGNWFNNYQYLQTTTFRNSNVIVSGNLSIQSGSVLQLGATTIAPTPVTGGIYYHLNDGFYVAEI